ncbi:putative oxidoreductase YdgJ [Sphingobium sp. AntQ-1]|uniref:oxidoreductase n=1 Tax=Sphingobium sp. AntQ-1 TaxID=2930091 RepID=UPI00234EF303|nr:oxidoreductase [Sphingobium sp. AntQ-1]WCP15477.1 putative oxidoreductase YdgJ [Sphingobium sp. AntQ-1]
MTARIRVGLIGYGMAGRVFHAPLIRAAPGLELAAIVTSRAEAVDALDPAIPCVALTADLLADPAIQAVVVATPSATHAAIAADALRAGKHVVVDKPFALSLDEAKALAALARNSGRRLAVFHNRRFDSDFLSIRAAIEEGAIGQVTHFESHFDRFRPEVRDRWREDGSAGSGVWFDLGPHLVDQALALFGRPLAVSADIVALRPGSGADDWAHVVLRYERMRVVLHASLNAPDDGGGGSPRFAVHGDKGSLIKRRIDPQEAQLIGGMRPGDAGWGVDSDPVAVYDGAGGMTLRPATRGCQEQFYRQMADTWTRGSVAPILLDEAVAVQEVIEAALLSARKDRVVAMPLP